MERGLDYRVQNNLSLLLLLSRSMSAAHTLTDYHFQLGFNFAISSTLCLPRRIFLSTYTVNILYFSYPCFIFCLSYSPCLTIVKAFRVIRCSRFVLIFTRLLFNIKAVFLSQYLTNLMHKICFTISFILCLYMFRAHVLIIRRSKLYCTASV